MDYINTNSAVIKAQLYQMNEQDFICSANEIKQLILDFDLTIYNANLRSKYLNLLRWCRRTYVIKFV